MTRAKHAAGRDVPHRQRRADEFKSGGARKGTREERTVADLARLTRVRKEDGDSFENRARGRDPRRPPFLMLFDDLAEPESPGVYGMYPASFIPKILPWLRCERSEVLHVCSGGLPKGEGIRVDIRPEANPDIVADGRDLPLSGGAVAAVLIDPPYSEHYAKELYGTDYPRPAHLLREAVRVVRPNGRIAFVHYIVPNPPEGSRFVKAFGLSMGFGYPMRAVTIYERDQLPLIPTEDPMHPTKKTRAQEKVMGQQLLFPNPPSTPLRQCRSCGADIHWIETRRGKRMPVNPDGTSHFATCPNAAQHRKPRP